MRVEGEGEGGSYICASSPSVPLYFICCYVWMLYVCNVRMYVSNVCIYVCVCNVCMYICVCVMYVCTWCVQKRKRKGKVRRFSAVRRGGEGRGGESKWRRGEKLSCPSHSSVWSIPFIFCRRRRPPPPP